MDPCQPNRCSNGATCTPTSNYLDYFCSCPLGFTGRHCDKDIDECENNPCRNGATW
jgi:Notch-like protein